MGEDRLFTISEFARLSGICRDNLIFYDRSGVLRPERIERNGYRYYGARQLGAAYLLTTLKEFGMPLKKIRAMTGERTPAKILKVFNERKAGIRREIDRLRQNLLMMEAYEKHIGEAGGVDENRVEVRTLPAESVFRGPVIRDFRREMLNEYIVEFYQYCEAKGVSFGFPLGREVSPAGFRAGEWLRTRRFYFRMPGRSQKKQGGLHVVGYARGDYYSAGHLYKRLKDFMAENRLELAGGAYEEYLLDEISTVDPDDYLMRLTIRVRRV